VRGRVGVGVAGSGWEEGVGRRGEVEMKDVMHSDW